MKQILLRSWLFFASIFCIVYVFFYTTSGRTPDWQYQIPLNFGEYSAPSPAIIQNDIIYFCAGARMTSRVSLNAVRKDGTALWSTLIRGQCDKLNISNNEIHVLHQNSVGLKQRHYRKSVTLDFGQTLIIDLSNGHILKTIKDQKYSPEFEGQFSKLDLRHSVTKDLNATLISPEHILVTDKKTGEIILDFGATGRIYGFIEEPRSLYVYDDDAKLYMFNR